MQTQDGPNQPPTAQLPVVNERWCATTLESIGDGVLTTDCAERVTFMNARAEELTGWSRAEGVGRPFGEVLRLVNTADGAIPSPVARALAARTSVMLPRQTSLLTRSGARLTVEDSTAPIVDPGGALLGVVIVFRDTTKLTQTEQRLAQTECLVSVGTMAAGIAHEINNPLTYVLANLALGRELLAPTIAALCDIPAALDPGSHVANAVARLRELSAMLSDADEGAERVRGIVGGLKKLTRADTVRTAVDLSAVLDAATRTTEHVSRHRARVVKAYGKTPLVDANVGQLTQVFTNLLCNAAEAIVDGEADRHEIRISTRTDEAGSAVVEVRDDGAGIARAILPKIFDPFFTTRAVGEGMGLGLAICHSLVHAIGGEIDVESEVGVGTTFRVILPAAGPDTTVLRPSHPDVRVGLRGKVLVVDDEPAVARAIARMLQAEHDVTVALNGHDALARLDAGETYDVIFCDLMMPNLNGMELQHLVEKAHPAQALRFVFVTGGAFSARTQRFLDETTNVHLTKPLALKTVRSIVRDYVNARGIDP